MKQVHRTGDRGHGPVKVWNDPVGDLGAKPFYTWAVDAPNQKGRDQDQGYDNQKQPAQRAGVILTV